VANLTLKLDVLALLERGRELAELAEDDAAMPFGMRDVLAGLFALVGGLGGEGERSELLVILAGANFSVVADEAHEDCFVLVHDVSPFLNSRSCSGHTWRSLASGADSQGRSSAFTEGPSQMETVTEGGVAEAEERACRRASVCPRSSDRVKAGSWLETHG
jgi:hypothetical protein